MSELTTSELLMLKKILVFYMHHHMSISNPQYEEVNQLIDKIRLKDNCLDND